ncbi:hypothetical protein WH8501_23740 [Crocosphaera watsonii WH 8501]|uniref:DNA topoisomerase I n=5 Tax=Crocosphaera watsonii TaxID=263511 RepID=T2JTX3_CROWT|nr:MULTISPECIES: hypothetical protein [Crocosphaera]EHJ11070.1 hypothetical protein CWATWH0003_4180 [Crocosphaera watsonii WH 0003]MCH2244750.1 hypothetical protein [Crocosphaera sp.]NQZ60944.1 hypothetical protein [Crocosphaera sp.]CCQ48768.1 hypothetical protein CWATWH8502_3803 [Crocosphaera watsonii WH 8502]CCQ54104.1 hypothetical protein CWATWH0005_4987 [Crocosphaera watsonii WH 0005]
MIESLNKVIAKLEKLSESEQEKMAQLMLKELENLTPLPREEKTKKLSDLLLLPELEENELLFERDKDTGREIIL